MFKISNPTKYFLGFLGVIALVIFSVTMFLLSNDPNSGDVTIDTGPQRVQHITEVDTDLGQLSSFEIGCFISYYYDKMRADTRSVGHIYAPVILMYQNELLLRELQGGHDAAD